MSIRGAIASLLACALSGVDTSEAYVHAAATGAKTEHGSHHHATFQLRFETHEPPLPLGSSKFPNFFDTITSYRLPNVALAGSRSTR